MKIGKLFNRLICFVLIVSIMVSTVGCSFLSSDSGDNSTLTTNEADTVIINDVAINDSFVTLELRGIENTGLSVEDIDIDEILVNCIDVTGIDTIEIEVTSINDEFVYLAYQNFVSVYGDDFDLKDFLVDMGIGAGCILVCVTLSVAGGPVGTFFGAIITSEFTTSAIVIGAAIDASVSAYQAYQEGGDASYIIGHMLNGVADGFKWSAILAPVTGGIEGIKALRAVNELRKVPGFENITDKQARKIFEQLADIIKKSPNVADDLSDEVIKELYQSLSKEVTEEISEDLLRNIITNRGLITDIVRKFNPFNVSSDVVKALQDDFIRKAGLTDDAGKELIKQIKNGTVKSLDDITDDVAREYIQKNLFEFVECFGGSLSKDFIDNCLKASLGDDVFELVSKSITTDNLYFELIEKLGKDGADAILSDSNTIILMQLRYGSKNVNKLLNVSALYKQMLKNSDSITEEQLKQVVNGILDGSIKSIDDVSRINAQIARNMCSSREAVALTIKSLGQEKALTGLLDDIAVSGLTDIGFDSACAADIIKNGLGQSDIIAKYGDDVYRKLIDNYYGVIDCLNLQASVNSSLIEKMTSDALRSRGITDDIVEAIMRGDRIADWGISDREVMEVCNIVSDYYRTTDATMYRNYILELGEKRGEYISYYLKDFSEAGNTINNSGRYAGCIMDPTGSKAEYIKAMYGDVYMSQTGFPIFDEYAVARVELSDLTGLNDGADDIARANLLHHGTQANVPGYTWHHVEDGKTMILIPTELHDAYRHTGGAALLRNGVFDEIENARDMLRIIRENNGVPLPNYEGGRTFLNNEKLLPEGVNYKEYDVNPRVPGQSRDAKRIVIGDDGSAWYTNDHYESFIRLD